MTFYWVGRAVSVNKWTGIRIMQKGGKQIPMVYKTPEYKHFIDSLATLYASAPSTFQAYVESLTVYSESEYYLHLLVQSHQ